MTFSNAKKVIIVGTCCLALNAAHLHCATAPEQKNVTSQQQADELARGKKLTCKEMDLLNALLKDYPIPVLRMDLAYKATLRVAQEIESSRRNDKQFIAEKIKSILAPVEQFFSIIQEYSTMVKPLVEESLLTSTYRSAEEHASARSNCMILKFFESNEKIDLFFNKYVTTKEQLIKACVEFATFFEDIRVSLSEPVKQSYQAMLEKLKNQKQSATSKK